MSDTAVSERSRERGLESGRVPHDNDTFALFDGSRMTVLERPSGPGDPLVMRFEIKSGGGAPPPHTHPSATEVFEVLEGEFEMLVDDSWQMVKAGESVTVAPGQRHTFRNHSGSEVVIRNVHDPHHDFERYIRSVATLSHELKATDPKDPKAAARFALLWGRHDDLIRPADLPLKVAFPILRGIGRLARMSVPD